MAEPCDFETAIAFTGFGRFNYLLLLAAFFSAMVVVWDTTTLSYVIPLAKCDLGLSSIHRGAVNAITYAGLITSSLLWGAVADTIGRIKTLKYAFFIDGILAFISAFSPSLWMLLLFRFLVGFMGCTSLPLTTTILTEFHDIQHRSPCMMTFGAFLGIGQVLLPALGLAMLLNTWEYDIGFMYLRPWNAFIMVCALPDIAGALVYSLLPETPKFLMTQGRKDEALAVMTKMYTTNTGNDPDTFPVESLVEEVPTDRRDTIASINVLVSRVAAACQQVPPLFSAEHVRMTMLFLFIMACDLLSLNTLRLWLPQLFTTLQEFYEAQEERGNTTSVYMCDAIAAHEGNLLTTKSLPLNLTVHSRTCRPSPKREKIYTNSMIVCSSLTLAVGISGVLVKYLGYKLVIISAFLLASIFCLSVLWSTGWITTVALFTFYLASLNIVTTCVLGAAATIFPTKLRATAVSISTMSGYVAALISLLLFPVVQELGCEIPFIIISCVLLAGGLASFAIPYTKGVAIT